MTYIYSPDGTTAHRSRRNLPATHWEVTSVDPPEGTYHDLTPANAESWGYYELVEVAQPDADHVRTIENIGPGLGFTEVWTFDQDLADANADQAARDAEAAELRDEIDDLKTERDDASTSKDDAALEVSEMTEFESDGVTPNPDWKNARWKALREDWPEDGTITLEEVGAALNDLSKKTRWLQTGQRQQWVAIRQLWGNVRHLTSAFIKKLRKDRDDE